jgi:hypothetical protein
MVSVALAGGSKSSGSRALEARFRHFWLPHRLAGKGPYSLQDVIGTPYKGRPLADQVVGPLRARVERVAGNGINIAPLFPGETRGNQDPERIVASITTTPFERPETMRLRRGKLCATGGTPSGLSAIIRPCSLICS